MIYPPLTSEFQASGIKVQDDRGQTHTLKELIQKSDRGDITLFVPGFAQCHGVCPTLARLYKTLFEDARVQSKNVSIVFFSFDPTETAESLAMFREHSGLSDQWQLVFANAADTQKLLSSLQYVVMKNDMGFDHPAQAFVFTKDLKWIGSLYGTDIRSVELLEILEKAKLQQNHPLVYSTLSIIENPNTLAMLGGGGLLLSVVFLMVFAIRFSTKKQRVSDR